MERNKYNEQFFNRKKLNSSSAGLASLLLDLYTLTEYIRVVSVHLNLSGLTHLSLLSMSLICFLTMNFKK